MTLRTATNLSIALRDVGTAYDEALEMANDVYDLFVQHHGEKHPARWRQRSALTNIQRAANQIDAALGTRRRDRRPLPSRIRHGASVQLRLHWEPRGAAAGHGDPASARSLNETPSRAWTPGSPATTCTRLVAPSTGQRPCRARRYRGRPRTGRGYAGPAEHSAGREASDDPGLRREPGDGSASRRRRSEADALLADTMSGYADTLGTEHPDAQVAATGQRLDFDFDPPPI